MAHSPTHLIRVRSIENAGVERRFPHSGKIGRMPKKATPKVRRATAGLACLPLKDHFQSNPALNFSTLAVQSWIEVGKSKQ